MSKFKMIISWFLVIATIMLSFVLFPFFSSTLPNYIGNEYYHDIYKPKTISTEKYIDEVFPWQYYDESKTTIYQNSDVIDDMEKQAESFLKSTMFSDDVILSLDFSQHTKRCGSDYLYVHNYKLIIDSKEYLLNLSYDITDNLIVMLHCDSGGTYDRNVIAKKESKLKQIVDDFYSKIEFTSGNVYTNHSAINADDSLMFYLTQISSTNSNINISSFNSKEKTITLYRKDMCINITNQETLYLGLLWNPYSENFEGFFFYNQ